MNFSFWHPYAVSLLIQMWVCLPNTSLRSALLMWISHYSIQVIYSEELNLSSLCPQEEVREVQAASSALPCPCWILESMKLHSQVTASGRLYIVPSHHSKMLQMPEQWIDFLYFSLSFWKVSPRGKKVPFH